VLGLRGRDDPGTSHPDRGGFLTLRFKLDENLSPEGSVLLEAAGHEVTTVRQESLGGAPDEDIAEACRREGRCLITADEDFAQIVEYPPEEYSGIIVLWHPHPNLSRMADLLRQVVAFVQKESPVGRLWIVEPGRVRVHEPTGTRG
jgi:predicted nuclease of predicted toxin-antitoxin system